MNDGTDGPSTTPTEVTYFEKLRTPWWWYVVAVGIASILAAEFRVGGVILTVWIPFGVLIPLSLLIVWFSGRSKLEISDGEIRTRGAHLPLTCCSGVVALDQGTLRRVVGREGDPAAYISIRPWIGPGVQLWVDDEDDPTPYWVLSTRHPDQLAAAVRASL